MFRAFFYGLLCLSLISCIKGKGDIVEFTFDSLDPFKSVDVRSNLNTVITIGPQQSVKAIGQENIINRMINRVNDEQLTLELERGNYQSYDLTIQITIPQGHYFNNASDGTMIIYQEEGLTHDSLTLETSANGSITGVGNFRVTNNVQVKNNGNSSIYFHMESSQLEASNSGNGQLFLTALCNEIKANLSGSGNINISGFTPTQIVQSTGSGDYKCFSLDSQQADVELSGSGNAEMRVSAQLNAIINSAGSLFYKGTPLVNSTITGTGEVVNLN